MPVSLRILTAHPGTLAKKCFRLFMVQEETQYIAHPVFEQLQLWKDFVCPLAFLCRWVDFRLSKKPCLPIRRPSHPLCP